EASAMRIRCCGYLIRRVVHLNPIQRGEAKKGLFPEVIRRSAFPHFPHFSGNRTDSHSSYCPYCPTAAPRRFVPFDPPVDVTHADWPTCVACGGGRDRSA